VRALLHPLLTLSVRAVEPVRKPVQVAPKQYLMMRVIPERATKAEITKKKVVMKEKKKNRPARVVERVQSSAGALH